MNWTVSALRTILAVVRDNFGPFFTTSLVFNAPLLIVDLIDGVVAHNRRELTWASERRPLQISPFDGIEIPTPLGEIGPGGGAIVQRQLQKRQRCGFHFAVRRDRLAIKPGVFGPNVLRVFLEHLLKSGRRGSVGRVNGREMFA